MKKSHATILASATGVLGTTASIWHASTLTSVVWTAAATANTTAVVGTKGGVMYMNVVEASLLSKSASALAGISITAFACYCIMSMVDVKTVTK